MSSGSLGTNLTLQMLQVLSRWYNTSKSRVYQAVGIPVWNWGEFMEVMVFIIMLGVALIDGKLWKVVLEQRRHNKTVEALLAEIRDHSQSAG